MQTITELVRDLGSTGEILAGGLSVRVRVLSVKQVYGKVRWLVTPVEGWGQVWVENFRKEEVEA